jgi:oligopeptide transport system ATP-binding protein
MYLGEIVEIGDKHAVTASPRHPYTRALLSAVPRTEAGRERHNIPLGDVPSPLSPPDGCRFHPRCPFAEARCRSERPLPRSRDDGRLVACHRQDEIPSWPAWDGAGMAPVVGRRLEMISRAAKAAPAASG